jgi:hypothetical protein
MDTEIVMAIVDYARPCMLAENALKAAHDAMLKRNYNEAIEQGFIALAEAKLMVNAIRDMQERAKR